MRHTKALILKREEWGEADWFVSALSEDFGRIRLLAQGSRKHGAKLQGHLEPGSCSDISFVVGRNGYRLTTARLLEPPMAFSAPLAHLRFLAAILATLEANLLEEPGSDGELFQVARESIHALSAAEGFDQARRIFVWFTAHFLRCLGLLPSPFVPEGRMTPSLAGFIRQPGLAALTAGSDPVRLEDELGRLCRELASAVRVVFPPVFADGLGGGYNERDVRSGGTPRGALSNARTQGGEAAAGCASASWRTAAFNARGDTAELDRGAGRRPDPA